MTRYELAKAAAAIGATVEEYGGRRYAIVVDAPAGYAWTDGAVHGLRGESSGDDKADRAAVRADLARRMAAGLEPCACGECK